ncbi:MAG TPA: hypothetical protein VF736_08220 [Pyrinomonadaceae bacterium]|jgi:ferric-dicitrate binding protein FerR (iron transport regulator)
MRRLYSPSAGRGLFDAARRGFAVLAAAALLNLAAPCAAANTPKPSPSGQVTVAAEGLLVDGSPAVTGQTFFTGASVATPKGETSSLDFGSRARVELSGGTSLRLDFTDASVGGALDAGGARVYAPQGVGASLTTADAAVSCGGSGDALFSLRAGPEGTTLSVQAGRVEMRAGGVARTAAAGESLHSLRGSAPAPPPQQQGNSLSGKKKAGLFVGIAAGIAAVILAVTLSGDEDEMFITPCPIFISPVGNIPPC